MNDYSEFDKVLKGVKLTPEERERLRRAMRGMDSRYRMQRLAFEQFCRENGFAPDHAQIHTFRFFWCAGWDYAEKKAKDGQEREVAGNG